MATAQRSGGYCFMVNKWILAATVTLVCASSLTTVLAQPKNQQADFGTANLIGGRPERKVEFPNIKDWNSLRITLRRGVCFGTCPAYSVEIDGDGTVIFKGISFVAVKGRRVAQISVQDVHNLFEKFREVDYFWSRDYYEASVTDLPASLTSIAFDDHKKSVGEYGGSMVGMPRELLDIATAIDQTAGTAKWIGHSRMP
jgi:hypothetical protein